MAERLISMGDPKEQLMFIISNDKRATRITLLTQTPDEDEWVSAGRFKVTSVHSEEFKDGSMRRTYVEIEQTAVFGYGVNAFLVPFPRAGRKARPEHATSTWFWSIRSTRSRTCSPAPSTDRTGRYSTRAGHHPGISDPP